jgi:hypothetical protein
VLSGSLETFAQGQKAPKGALTVDQAFLREIEGWRELLAHNIVAWNASLSQRDLNYAVQMTLDRIIFLRICEDRGIEQYGRLQSLLEGGSIYTRLVNQFKDADDRYNSGLFHFSNEKGREGSDTFTPTLHIDDEPLQKVIRNLYYPDSPYEFSVLPIEVLGSVYERFLGKVITVEPGRKVTVEAKPEVRKAGGVYYTPDYIVRYIVENTVGKLLEGRTPSQVSKLRIADPACGSGSFLVGAYQHLLDWHLNYYIQNGPERRKKEVYRGRNDEWRLTIGERRRILLNNIYGVDLDQQAVEVTKLSLLLKVLEGETEQTMGQLQFARERALPDLGQNIKCGNSLIGPDFYDSPEAQKLSDEELYRVNAFDWEGEFPKVMRAGGFDAVIGNPPWGSLIRPTEKTYLVSRYVNRRGEAESHLFFIEKALNLLSSPGLVGFITPNTWLSVLNSRELRQHLLKTTDFKEICELSDNIFHDAPAIVPIILVMAQRTAETPDCVVKTTSAKVSRANFTTAFMVSHINQAVWEANRGTTINLKATSSTLKVLSRCHDVAVDLGKLCDVLYGIKTGDNTTYLSRTPTDVHTVKALKTGELVRYHIEWNNYYLWWCQALAGYRTSSVQVPKVVVQYIRNLSLPRRIIAALDEDGLYYPLNNYSYITPKEPGYSLKYILGIFNSALINYYFANTFIDYNIKPTYLQQLPIRTIDFSNPPEKACHDQMAQLVERMLDLQKRLPSARTSNDKIVIQRQIDTTDRQIDRLVYNLYGLTEDEVQIVEEATRPV